MTDIATYRINYRLDDWERIAAERGELCAPIGAVRAVNALCDEVESLRQQVREQQGEPVTEVSAEKGLTYGGRPEQPIGTLFYTAPTIPAPMEHKRWASDYEEGVTVGWNSCRDEMLSAPKGEKK